MKERFLNWKGWKAAVKTACFLLVLALVLGRADAVLAFKQSEMNGSYSMERLYNLDENSVDVLILGSSHAYVNIDPGTLWEERGIPAYILGGEIQPFWNTRYYLKEALKTQTPRLVVMDAYTATFTKEYNDNGRAVSNTFGMKWSRDKAEAMRLSAPPDRLSGFFLGYCQYHARFRELGREDFLANLGDSARYADWKGSYVSTLVNSGEWPADVQTEERKPMTAKTEEWYRKTIELARSRGVPLLIVVNPYPGVTEAQQAVFNTAADIAGEYGVPFVNFNEDFAALDLDPAVDYIDSGHMNVWGSRKFTRQLGELLTERYDLPDRRGDPAYQSWENNARYIAAFARDGRLAQGAAPEEAASLLLDPDYTCAVGVSGGGGTVFAPLLEALGVPAGEEGLWLSSGGEALWASGAEGTEYFTLDRHDLKLSRTGGGNAMVFDKGGVEQVRDGVTVFVYDRVTQAEAARLTFDAAALSQ